MYNMYHPSRNIMSGWSLKLVDDLGSPFPNQPREFLQKNAAEIQPGWRVQLVRESNWKKIHTPNKGHNEGNHEKSLFYTTKCLKIPNMMVFWKCSSLQIWRHFGYPAVSFQVFLKLGTSGSCFVSPMPEMFIAKLWAESEANIFHCS